MHFKKEQSQNMSKIQPPDPSIIINSALQETKGIDT